MDGNYTMLVGASRVFSAHQLAPHGLTAVNPINREGRLDSKLCDTTRIKALLKMRGALDYDRSTRRLASQSKRGN